MIALPKNLLWRYNVEETEWRATRNIRTPEKNRGQVLQEIRTFQSQLNPKYYTKMTTTLAKARRALYSYTFPITFGFLQPSVQLASLEGFAFSYKAP